MFEVIYETCNHNLVCASDKITVILAVFGLLLHGFELLKWPWKIACIFVLII